MNAIATLLLKGKDIKATELYAPGLLAELLELAQPPETAVPVDLDSLIKATSPENRRAQALELDAYQRKARDVLTRLRDIRDQLPGSKGRPCKVDKAFAERVSAGMALAEANAIANDAKTSLLISTMQAKMAALGIGALPERHVETSALQASRDRAAKKIARREAKASQDRCARRFP